MGGSDVEGGKPLVEDNTINLEVANSILEREACIVTTATNGRIALEVFETEQFDVVLMDCQMPEMDGFQAVAAIRALEAKTGRHTPVIALTANAIEGDRENCLRAGMDDYLPKPISREAIREVLGRWLMKGRERRVSIAARKCGWKSVTGSVVRTK